MLRNCNAKESIVLRRQSGVLRDSAYFFLTTFTSNRKKNRVMTRIFICSLFVMFSKVLFARGFPQDLIDRQVQQASQPVAIDIASLEPGMVLRIKYLDRPILIYRRTAEEIEQLKTLSPKLADPASENWRDSVKSTFGSASSQVWTQLLLATNRSVETSRTRSIQPEYFVVAGWSPYSGCAINIVSKQNARGVSFHDPCVKNDFDAAGRIFAGEMKGPRTGESARFNLFVPPHRFIGPTMVEIGLPEGETLPEIPADFYPSFEGISAQEVLRLGALFNRKSVVLSAISRGASVAVDLPGQDPLAAAVIGSDIEIVRLMLELGAEPTHRATEAAKFLEREDVLELFGKYAAHNK